MGRAQQLPDAAGEMALERSDGLAMGLAFGLLAREELDRLDVTARAGDGHAVNGGTTGFSAVADANLPVSIAEPPPTARMQSAAGGTSMRADGTSDHQST